MKKYSVEEFRIYLESQDSFGDIFYNLSEEKIDKAIWTRKVQDSIDLEEDDL